MNLLNYLKEFRNNNKLDLEIAMEKDIFKNYKSNKKNSYNGFSFEIVHYLLNNEYSKLQQRFKSDIKLGISIIVDGTLVFIDDEVGFINTLAEMKKNNLLSKTEIRKYEYLRKSIDYNHIFYKNKNKLITYVYHQNIKSFPLKEIYKLFSLEHDKFKKVVESCFFNLPTEECLIILLTFINEYANEKSMILPNNIKLNVEYIKNKTKNFHVFDKIILKKHPSYMKMVNINSDFENYILDQIPNNFSKIEKAFYIYLLLCRTFTYDVIEVNGGKTNIKHRNIERISEINEVNNVVLCYEFIVIYAKFLDKLGLNYEIDKSYDYARGHINLCIQYKDSKIDVEPTRGVIDCDLTNAKIGVKLEGFNYNYSNPSTYEEINKAVNNVYEYFDKNLGIKYKKQTELINENREIFKKQNKNILLKERFEFFIKKLINLDLPPVEIIKRLNMLKKVVFEDLNIFDFYLVANTEKMSYPENVSISLVLVFNEFGINKGNNEYYIYKYPKNIAKISKEDLQKKFDYGKYTYVKAHKKEIPGIVEEKYLVKTANKK